MTSVADKNRKPRYEQGGKGRYLNEYLNTNVLIPFLAKEDKDYEQLFSNRTYLLIFSGGKYRRSTRNAP